MSNYYLQKGSTIIKAAGGVAAVWFGYKIGYPYTREMYFSNWLVAESNGYEVYKIENAFKKLQDSAGCQSLLKKHITKEIKDKLKFKKTKLGGNLHDVINSGVENPDSSIGVYATDAEAYKVFSSLFDPIIEEYHHFGKDQKQPDIYFGDDKISELEDLDPEGKYVQSTRIRCVRNLTGYPFNPLLSQDDYLIMEEKLKRAFISFNNDNELKGSYFSLKNLSEDIRQSFISEHFLFKECDRFLQAAKACRYWPDGRGIYHNDDKTFFVWVNEEDHLRIISMQQGGNIGEVLERLNKAVEVLESKINFKRDRRLGWLTFCPSNLGTTIRASVHIKLPIIGSKKEFKEICSDLGLQTRGIHGEHSENIGGVYDVSNQTRLGLTEFGAVKQMYDGVKRLIELEKEAESTS